MMKTKNPEMTSESDTSSECSTETDAEETEISGESSGDTDTEPELVPGSSKKRLDRGDAGGRTVVTTAVTRTAKARGDKIDARGDDDHDQVRGRKDGHRRGRRPTICLTHCRYEIVRDVAKRFGLKEVTQEECWNIYWTDYSVSLERAMDIRRFQIINHFPGMNEICRKDLLARNLNRMQRLFPKEYNIFPKTWNLPADLGDFQNYAFARKNKTYICKPQMGCQGRGIFLIRTIKDLNPFGKIICQKYIGRPLLIDDLKFDLRIYVLITSCDPLRIYVFKEGLARFATAKYKPPTNGNTENSYMHLTNYAVNKFSRDFDNDEESGTKRRLTSVYKWLGERNFDINGLMESIDEVIVKTIISAHPALKHNYRTCFPNHDVVPACFEILGFDILIDRKLKPFVLEVNHSPSFHTETKLDLEIKDGLVNDTFNMLNIKLLDRKKIESDDRKRTMERLFKNNVFAKRKDLEGQERAASMDPQFAHEIANSGGYRLIYPTTTSNKYDVFFEQNLPTLYQDTTASQARAIFTKTQLEEFQQKRIQEENKRIALKRATTGPEGEIRDKDSSSSIGTEPTIGRDSSTPVKRKTIIRPSTLSNFSPVPIIASEELERMKGIMQRGMLVRSLGVETLVFKLLCQVRSLKPEEEKIYRQVHGLQ